MKKIKVLAIVLGVLLTAGPQLLAQHVTDNVTPTGRIVGRVVDGDGNPVRDAVVVAYHVSGQQEFKSPPTGGNGEYRLDGLPFGYLDVGVEVGDGVYVSDRAVNLPPAGKAALILTIQSFQPGTERLSRAHPASELEPGGVAVLRAKPKGRDFWRTPKGVAILGSIGGAALLAIASGSNDEPAATIF